MAFAWCVCCDQPTETEAEADQGNWEVEADQGTKDFYISGQWTHRFVEMHHVLLEDLSGFTVKASMPPFNNPDRINFPDSVVLVNVPVFGVKITNAALRIFDSPAISSLLNEVGFQIPQKKLSPFVQQKMFKVYEMLEAGRAEPSIAETQKEAMDRVERYCKEFENLTSDTIDSVSAWEAFLNKHVMSDWADKLHIDDVLSNFGFDQDAAAQLGHMEYVYKDEDKTTPYSEYSLRWLSKSFLAYGPQVMVTDIVNLIFAMMNLEEQHNNNVAPDEAQIAAVIEEFGEKLKDRNVDDLWVPTHFVMDAESDDFMAWAVIEYVHRLRGTQLEVLVQLAMDPELDVLAGKLAAKMKCSIIRDKESRNAEAIKKFITAAALKSTSTKSLLKGNSSTKSVRRPMTA